MASDGLQIMTVPSKSHFFYRLQFVRLTLRQRSIFYNAGVCSHEVQPIGMSAIAAATTVYTAP
jgi:hypothetical protein